jgi:hypothetical protein
MKIIGVTQAVNRSAVKEVVVVVYHFNIFMISAFVWNK